MASFTFHGFEGARCWAAQHHMAGRIDWILTLDGARPVRPLTCLIAHDQEPPVFPSDHYPVVADLDLRTGKQVANSLLALRCGLRSSATRCIRLHSYHHRHDGQLQTADARTAARAAGSGR